MNVLSSVHVEEQVCLEGLCMCSNTSMLQCVFPLIRSLGYSEHNSHCLSTKFIEVKMEKSE